MILVHQVLDGLSRGPPCLLVEALAELLERQLIHGLDFWDVALPAGYAGPFSMLPDGGTAAGGSRHLICRYRYTTNCFTMSGTAPPSRSKASPRKAMVAPAQASDQGCGCERAGAVRCVKR
jgi:hypothetical protein